MPKRQLDLQPQPHNLLLRQLKSEPEEESERQTNLARQPDLLTATAGDWQGERLLPATPPTQTLLTARLLGLQQRYGNRAVQRLVNQPRQTETGVAPAVETAIQAARGGGESLDSRVRAEMEPALRSDFGEVRLHTDGQADRLNRTLHARAFTTGHDIFFKQGEYNPSSASGRELLAHELTHVVQQQGQRVQTQLLLSQPGDEYEQEADRVARTVIQQEQPSFGKVAGQPTLRRQGEDEEEATQVAPTRAVDEMTQRQSEEEEERETAADTGALQRQITADVVENEGIQRKAAPPLPQQTPTQPAAQYQSPPGSERAWSHQNPQGLVDTQGDRHFILSNFAVNSATLTPEHRACLDAIARQWPIYALRGDALLYIDGHASRSGKKGLNQALSNRRARAVADYLVSQRVTPAALRLNGHGYTQPRFPNLSGRTMAYNRRVEVRIDLPQSKTPEPKPIFEPPPQKMPPAPKAGELGELLPNGEFAIKVPIDPKVPIPCGPALIHPSGEINGVFKLVTQRPETIRGYWQSGKLGVAAKTKLTEGVEFKMDGSGVGFSFYNLPLGPELAWNLVEIHKPVSFNLTQKLYLGDPIDLGEGIKVTGYVELKMKFGVGPNPALAKAVLAKSGLGAAGGIVTGAIVGTLLITGGVAKLVASAGEEGLAWAHSITRRSAYALRIAAEVTGEQGTNPPAEIVERLENLKTSGTWEQAWQGWQVADAGLQRLTPAQREQLAQALRKRYGGNPTAFYEAIFRAVGGTSRAERPLPSQPLDLLR